MMKETFDTWQNDLEERLREIDEKFGSLNEKMSPLVAKIKTAELAAKMFKGEEEQSEYFRNHYIIEYEKAYEETEDVIKELMKERRSVAALIDAIKIR